MASYLERDQDKQIKLLSLGRDLLLQSGEINSHDQDLFFTQSLYLFSQDGDSRGLKQLTENLDYSQFKHPLYQILKAMKEFSKDNYLEALQILKQVLKANPLAPPSIRFGIGLCYYRLGNINKATFAFQRVIELDPDNSMAKVGLAVVEMA